MKISINTPRWGVDFLQPARYKGAFGGRGSGKSHFFGEMLVEQHVLNPNHHSVCIREVQKSLNQSVKRLIETKIQDLNVGYYFDVQDAVIKCHGGKGLIIFQGMQNHTADSIKSLEGYDTAWIEEAQTVSQHSLDLLRPTIRKEGSEIWATWNPRFEDDPIETLLRSSDLPKGSVVREVNYRDNPWFPDVLREEMEYDRARDLDKYEHVWCGGYVKSSKSRVFNNWKVQEFEAPKDAHLRFGADWGFAVDPTVLVRCYIVGRTLFIDYEAHQVGCEIVNTPDLFMTVPESEKWPIVADGARPETISHMRRNGFSKIMPAVKGAGSVEDGIEWLKSFDIVVHPRCEHTIKELTRYSYKVDSTTGAILPILEDKNNHVIDAVRYACESARRAQNTQPVTVEPMPIVSRW
jgi:phage terminase large subunit